MAHTTAKAVFAAKRAHLNLPMPGDDYAPPDDEQMTSLDGEPIDLDAPWPMPTHEFQRAAPVEPGASVELRAPPTQHEE